MLDPYVVFLILFQVEEMVELNFVSRKVAKRANSTVRLLLLLLLYLHYYIFIYTVDFCEACNGSWTEVSVEGNTTVQGKQWCFEGDHSLHSLSTTLGSDMRVIRSDEVNLNDGPNLQAELDSLPLRHSKVKRLTIHAKEYDEESRYSFDAILPELGNDLQLLLLLLLLFSYYYYYYSSSVIITTITITVIIIIIIIIIATTITIIIDYRYYHYYHYCHRQKL